MYILALDVILAAFRWNNATRILHPAMQLRMHPKKQLVLERTGI